MSQRNLLPAILLAAILLPRPSTASAQTQTPPKAPSTRPAYKPELSLDEMFLPDLTSKDQGRVTGGVKRLETYSQQHWSNRASNLTVLFDAGLYTQADQAAIDLIVYDPATTPAVAGLAKIRVQALLAANQPAKALAAARAYYNVGALKDTADAIDQVSLCLAAAHPNDPAIVRKFKEQQVAWSGASAQPTNEPSDSVLAGVEPDAAPFTSAIAKITLTEYKKYVAKGNLLLLAGQAGDARSVFEQSLQIAPAGKASEAIENVARAIRAEAGCVGPANAYILKLREPES